jgi:hypothetical protein
MPKKSKDVNYYLDYLIKLNSHQIQDPEEPSKISKIDKMFLLTHDESKVNNLKIK